MKNTIFIVALLIVGLFAVPANVDASGHVELEGFAWAATIGWISMNCSDTNTCTIDDPVNGIDYSVQIKTDGRVTGHAWSPNAGWIQFGGLGSFPTVGTATINDDVEVVGAVSMTSNFSFTGWARACAATVGGDCSSMTTDTNVGDWDGWISMSGSYGAGSYGITFVNGAAANTPTSYAWGGPNTMGWIDFSPDGIDPDFGVRLKELPDIVIEAVNPTPGVIQPDGTFNTVTFNPIVTGIPDTRTVDWDLSVGGLVIESGTITQNGSTANFDRLVVLTNVPGGIPQQILFEVDMPVSASQVTESNEVNERTLVLNIPYPAPVITFDGPDVIRAGDRATVTVTVDAPYDTTCSFIGPGVNRTFEVVGAVGSGPVTEQSDELRNGARFEVSCTAGPDVYTEVYQVEVIPTFQEV
jgi:hypothetical protein